MKVVEAVDPAPDTPAIGPLANFTGSIPSDLKGSSAFQIVYNPYECNEGSSADLTLCIFTPTQQERDNWLWNIRTGEHTLLIAITSCGPEITAVTKQQCVVYIVCLLSHKANNFVCLS